MWVKRVVGALLLSGTLAVPSAADVAYLPYSERESLGVLDLESGTIVGEIDLGVAAAGIAVSADGSRVFVASGDSSRVLVVDAHQQRVVGSVRAKQDPADILLIDRLGIGFVGNRSGESITVFEAATSKVIGKLPALRPPRGMVASPAGHRLYLAQSEEDMSTPSFVMSLDTREIRYLDQVQVGPGASALSLTPDGRVLLVLHSPVGVVSFFDTSDLSPLGFVPVGEEPGGMAVSSDGRTAYVSSRASDTISVIDLTQYRVVDTLLLEGSPGALVLSEGDGTLYALSTELPSLLALDLETGAVSRLATAGPSAPVFGRFVGPKVPRTLAPTGGGWASSLSPGWITLVVLVLSVLVFRRLVSGGGTREEDSVGEESWWQNSENLDSAATGIPSVDSDAVRELLAQAPAGLLPEDWDERVLGDRLRWLILSGHLVPMEVEERELIRTLPSWLRYGPQHGFPVEWFSPNGVLLPRYRPGAGGFGEFRRQRRRYRVMSRVLISLEERVRVFRRDRGGALFLGWMMLVYLVGMWLTATPHDPLDFDADIKSGLKTVGIFAFAWLGVGVAYLALHVYVRCLVGKLDRRLRSENG